MNAQGRVALESRHGIVGLALLGVVDRADRDVPLPDDERCELRDVRGREERIRFQQHEHGGDGDDERGEKEHRQHDVEFHGRRW